MTDDWIAHRSNQHAKVARRRRLLILVVVLIAVTFVLVACRPEQPEVAVSGPPVTSTSTTTLLVSQDTGAPRQVAPTTTTTTVAPTTTRAPVVTAPAASGGCFGYRDLVASIFGSEVDVACRVMSCESQGNPRAVSSTNDHGLMQLNAPTWNRAGTGDPVADFIHANWSSVYDPATNLRMAKMVRDKYGWRSWTCAR